MGSYIKFLKETLAFQIKIKMFRVVHNKRSTNSVQKYWNHSIQGRRHTRYVKKFSKRCYLLTIKNLRAKIITHPMKTVLYLFY